MGSAASQRSRANRSTGLNPSSGNGASRPHFSPGTAGKIGEYALIVSVFFSSYHLLRIGSVNITLSDLALLGCLFTLAARGRLNAVPFGSLTSLWSIGLVLMLGGLFIGTIINGAPLRWVTVAVQYLVAFLLIPMVLMGENIPFTRRLTIVYVLGVALSETIGIVSSFLYGFQELNRLFGNDFLAGNGRLGAMAGEANLNGASVAFALPMLIYAVRKEIIPALAGIVCAVPLIWGVLASGSFTGFCASVISVGLVMVFSGVKSLMRLGLVLAAGAALFVASGAPLPKAFEDRVAGAVSTGDLDQAGTFTNRAELVEEAWQRAEDNLVIGLGVDRFREISPHGQPVHELHLLILNEGGAIAFLGLLIILGLMVVLALLALFRIRDEGAMALAVVAVFMVYTFSIPHMYSRLWVLPVMVALSTVYARRSLVPDAGRARQTIRGRIAA